MPPPRSGPNARLRANVRSFYAWIGSMILLGIAPALAARLIDRQTFGARIAGVVIGVGGTLPWMWIVLVMIRRSDEYTRRIHLLALGGAFGAALVLILALEMLRRAGFIDPPDLMLLWLALLVIWFAALMAAKRYFERSV